MAYIVKSTEQIGIVMITETTVSQKYYLNISTEDDTKNVLLKQDILMPPVVIQRTQGQDLITDMLAAKDIAVEIYLLDKYNS